MELRLGVTNLGPIREAEIDLGKRLIVLTGPNDSGKTWLTWCVYGFLKMPMERLATATRPFAEELLQHPDHRLDAARTEDLWQALIAAYPVAMKSRLPEVFALPEEHFATTVVTLRGQVPRRVAVEPAYFRSQEVIFVTLKEDGIYAALMPSPESEEEEPGATATASDAWEKFPVADMSRHLGQLLHSALWPRPLIFPAERVGVQLFAREIGAERSRVLNEMLVRTRTSAIPDDADEPSPVGYPLAISDFQQFVLTPHPFRNRTKRPPLAEELENEILSGSLTFDKDGGVTLTPRGGGQPLPLASTSSLTKALAQLVSFFRERAPNGNVLLGIDEPESNLHPEQQVRIARFLARVVRAGFRVMLSTHSDYIIRELNQCIMASHPHEAVRAVAREMGYAESMALEPHEVGAYHVHDGLAEHLKVTETGFRVPSIDAVIEKQTDTAQRFYAAIDAVGEAPTQEPT